MAEITDAYMMEMLTKVKAYSILILKPGPERDHPDSKQIIWEHGRKNFQLRDQGLLNIVCPIAAEKDICGIGIFNADEETVRRIAEEDPAVQAGIFVYDVLPCRSFPGDSLA